jgi:hypothetical protein
LGKSVISGFKHGKNACAAIILVIYGLTML